jgi:hypothetical protein
MTKALITNKKSFMILVTGSLRNKENEYYSHRLGATTSSLMTLKRTAFDILATLLKKGFPGWEANPRILS